MHAPESLLERLPTPLQDLEGVGWANTNGERNGDREGKGDGNTETWQHNDRDLMADPRFADPIIFLKDTLVGEVKVVILSKNYGHAYFHSTFYLSFCHRRSSYFPSFPFVFLSYLWVCLIFGFVSHGLGDGTLEGRGGCCH